MDIGEKMIPEKLLEEIYERCDKFYGRLFVYPEIKVSIDERRRFIKQLITRIGKAVLSGESKELDKILGVVGRDRVYYINDEGPGGIVTVDYLDEKVRPDDILIALRKEEEQK